jgi:iron complex outermembrane recepter protein
MKCGKIIFLIAILLNTYITTQALTSSDSIKSPFDTLYRELDEVVISATRVAARIIDIPYAVSRINFVNYRFDRKIGSNDMLSSVPGLFLQSRYGTHDVRFSIRGFGSRSNSGVRGVRILLDDIPESEPDGQTRLEALDFDAIGRIEVVKGSASSLYTNAPGGVASFFNDIAFTRSSITSLNQFGSFGLRKNGMKVNIRTPQYGFLGTYSYLNYDGYRAHNSEYWNIVNLVLETTPSDHTSLKVLGYYVDGQIKLPGSLTLSEFVANPWQASQRSVDRDEKRITTKGRLGLRYNAVFGGNLNNEIEFTSFVAIKYFERTAKDYRIISRNVYGVSLRYVNTSRFWERTNEFAVGGDLFMQPARIENYDNINGTKGDQLIQLEREKISNKGFYISENFEMIRRKLYLLITARYDNVIYDIRQETAPSLTDRKPYSAVTPKVALNFKIGPQIALYGSYGLSFDSPANNEMESPNPAFLYNNDLRPQESRNAEVGIKGNIFRWNSTAFRKLLFEATLFHINLTNEIVPFEVLGDVYYRNAAKTNRSGCELGFQLELFRDLNFTLSYTYSYFKYDQYNARSIEADSTGTLIITDKDYAGNFAPSVPRNNLFLSMAYARSINKQITGFVKLSYTGISGMWVDDANSAKTQGYNLLNSTLGFDIRAGHFNLLISGGVNNVFDEIYVGFTNTNSADKRYYEAGAPRDWFLTVNLGYTF